MIRALAAALALAASVPSPAAAGGVRCELDVGLAAPDRRGAPALSGDGGILMIVPPSPVLHVDGYPALLTVRARVANGGSAEGRLRSLDGDPSALLLPAGGWWAGAHLAPGDVVPAGGVLEETVVVPVASQAACIALGGDRDEAMAAPACRSAGGGLRMLATVGGARGECRARVRCGPDAAVPPTWKGARQFGWAGGDAPMGMALHPAGSLLLPVWASDGADPSAPPRGAIVEVMPDGAVAAAAPTTPAGFTYRALVAEATGATVRVENRWGDFGDVVRRIGRDGAEVWSRAEGTAEVRLAAGPGGTLVTAAYEFGPDVLVTKYTATGEVVWRTRLATPPLDDRPQAVAVDGLGAVWVLGYRYDHAAPPPASQVFLARLDAGGTLLWTRTLPSLPGGLGDDLPAALAVTRDGIAAVAWSEHLATGGPRAGIAAFDADGAPIWTWSPTLAGRYLSVNGLAADPRGGFWASATTPSWELEVVRVTSSGEELWTRRVAPSPTQGAFVAVDGAGNAYVSGMTLANLAAACAGSWDVFVVRLGPDGVP